MDVVPPYWKQILFVTTLWSGYTFCIKSENIALGKPAYQSGTAFSGLASYAVDGGLSQNFNDRSCTCTANGASAFWEVDLGELFLIGHVTVYNRLDCCADRLRDVELYIGENTDSYRQYGFHQGPVGATYKFQLKNPVIGRWVRITRLSSVNDYLTLCEVQVYPPEYHYFRMTPNMVGNGQITKTVTAESNIHCSYLCLKSSDCEAANYFPDNSRCDLLLTGETKYPANGTLFLA